MMAFLKMMAYYPHGSALEALEFRVNHHFEVYGTCRWLTDLYRVNTKECILLALPCDKWQREVINGFARKDTTIRSSGESHSYRTIHL